jgi:peptide/nickel transport system substrate-binding protein
VDAFTDVNDHTGSGPFVFLPDEWVSGARAAFRRNERYLPRPETPSLLAGGKVVNFDRVEWTTMPDATTAAGALETGEVDWLDAPLIDLVPRLRKVPNVTVAQLRPFGVWFELVFNTNLAHFDNPALRRAVLAAVDQAGFMQAVVGEQADLMRTGIGLFAAESPLRTESGMQALTGPRDLDLARRRVKESGYTGTPVVQMAVSDVSTLALLSLVAQDMMTRIGLNVAYQSVDNSTFVARQVSGAQGGPGSWNFYCTFWTGMRVLYPGSHSPLFVPVPVSDPQMLELRNAWFDAADLAAEKSIAERMQRRMFEEALFVPLGETLTPSAHRTGLTGFVPSNYAVFWNVRRA